MSFLNEWIRHIVTLIIFASFIEMLMPHSNMKRFVKMIMGLVIILVIVSPLGNLLRGDWENNRDIFDVQLSSDWEEIKNDGFKLQEENMADAKQTYQQVLEKQVKGFVLSQDGVGDANVNVILQEDNNDQVNGIEHLDIGIISADSSSIQKKSVSNIEPIVIQSFNGKSNQSGLKEKTMMRENELTSRIKNTVIHFFDLQNQQIKVFMLEDEGVKK